jgi:hypothetical protein
MSVVAAGKDELITATPGWMYPLSSLSAVMRKEVLSHLPILVNDHHAEN